MELLQAEINRKRKINEDIRLTVRGTTTAVPGNTTSKYIRPSERQKLVELELEKEQSKIEEERLKRVEAVAAAVKKNIEGKGKLHGMNELKALQSNHNNPSTPRGGADNNVRNEALLKQLSILSITEIKRRLRSIGHPITLFAESDSERVNRLASQLSKAIDAEERGDREEEEDEYRIRTKKQPTDEQDEAELDAEDLLELPKDSSLSKDKDKDPGASNLEHEEDSGDEDDDKEVKADIKLGPTIKYSEIAGLPAEKMVYKFFRAVLKQWEEDLLKRTERPLFKLCKKKEVPGDILYKLEQMVSHCEKGNFRAANDCYISTAIGNSAWPIGLTMVGIHERSGREKISTSKVAHMMNNEQQRKYLTSVKRLMTYAQNKATDVAPSMKVN
eukprot:gene31803-41274_t